MLAVATRCRRAWRSSAGEVSLPLWFLSVYVLVVAAAPALLTAHRRVGGGLLLVLVAGTVLADIGHYGLDQAWMAIANYAFVWLAMLELGFLWRDGVLTARPWIPWALLAGGLVVVGTLVTWFDYPVSMITLSKADRSNAFPPSLALLALGFAQTGLVLLLEGAANRWLGARASGSRSRPGTRRS